MRSNREYDYFGNVLEYEYDYFASYSSMSTSTQKVLLLEYEYDYSISGTFVSKLLQAGLLLVQVLNCHLALLRVGQHFQHPHGHANCHPRHSLVHVWQSIFAFELKAKQWFLITILLKH